MHHHTLLIVASLLLTTTRTTYAQDMPRENVIDVPAISKGFCVSNVFQSNMVLQREKPIVIWGWAEPGRSVSVTFARTSQTTTANQNGRWTVTWPQQPANPTPQQMTLTAGDQTLTLKNILIGDVWVLGGQSNMEFPLDRIENGELEIVSAHFPNIRILTVPAQNGSKPRKAFPRLHEWSSWFGRHYRKGDWDICTPKIARELSAIGYVFARRIHMASQVPIGIIDASRGGTTVETWTPTSILRAMTSPQVTNLLAEWDQKVDSWDTQADLQKRVEGFRQKVVRLKKEGKELPANETEPTDLRPGPAMDQNRPGNCFASMIHPLAGLQVKGAIFHQGYNNCFNGTEGALLYRTVFPEMIKAWRKAFQDPDLPFGILSLCTEGTVQTTDNFCEMMFNPGPFIREAQYQTFLDFCQAGDTTIGFVSTHDLRRRWYHPQLKIPAGERIARWALATQYGFEKSIRWKPPVITEFKIGEGRIELQFDQPVRGLDDGSPIQGFAIAADDRKFQPANAEFAVIGEDDRGRPRTDKRRLVLTSPLITEPTEYRYAWGRSPLANLQADRNSDIPVATQRSDTWSLENVPADVHEEPVEGKVNGQQRSRILNALRALDRQRILFEADALRSAEN